MTEVAIVYPLLPGKREALNTFTRTLMNERKDDHSASHTSVFAERWFLQATPMGELVVVYLKTPDPIEVFANLAVSQDPFVVWFRANVLDITGVNLASLPPFALPECVFHADRDTGLPSDRNFEAREPEIAEELYHA